MAQITSSQRGLGVNGPFLVPYLLDVKTVTGVVFDGVYRPVGKVDEVEGLAAAAYDARKRSCSRSR